MKKIKIIIADDHKLVIEGLDSSLKPMDYITIIDKAYDGIDLLNKLKHHLPDIILLDINMDKLDGLEAAKLIIQDYPEVKIIMLTTSENSFRIKKAKSIGVHGYVVKTCDTTELIKAIDEVANGKYYFTKKAENSNTAENCFTNKELEVIHLIGKGFTNQQIAAMLFNSIYTIETHRKHIMEKINKHTPSELYKYILENNL
jgi:two-component system nitrate/nitrite response regulator NarL